MLPAGTVTFLFTDIEGSTARWEANSERMSAALADHNKVFERIAAEYSGAIFKTVGDAYCIAFSSAEDAASAAIAAQENLARSPDPLLVRMALHTASIHPTGDDYFGPPLNRVARILSAANGGQIVMSDATKGLLPSKFAVKSLGAHALKDLLEPANLWQLGSGNFGELRGMASIRNNLPLQTTSFVGRTEEMEQLQGFLEKSRLITLTGTGGTGKSRLALQFAAENMERFPDGVWFCELAPLPEREDVLRAIVAAVGAPDVIGTLQDRLVMYLSGKRSLVILDNCEHVLDAASKVAESLILSCPLITIVATSREPLGARGEVPFRVPSLPSPDPSRRLSLDDLDRFGSTALFVDRLSIAAPSYELQPQEAGTIAHICNRLDGIPLAIELAAARGRAMSLEHIEKRLDDRFRLLTGGSRNALSRQQTLRALIDWSVQLLDEQERRFFVTLSVFGGGWNLDAAEAVCTDEAAGTEEWQVLDLLTALVDKSLVVYERSSDRYRMLESVRQYALERLEQTDMTIALRDRHAEHFLKLAAPLVGKHTTESSVAAHRKFANDYENFRTAVEWVAGQEGGRQTAIQALSAASQGFHSLGRPDEFVRMMKPLLEDPDELDPETLSYARLTLTICKTLTGDPQGLEDALAARDQFDKLDPEWRARWRIAIGHALFMAGRYEEDIEFVRAGIRIEGEAERTPWFHYLYMHEGNSLAALRRFDEALTAYRACIAGLGGIGDERGCVAGLSNMVTVHTVRGSLRDAIEASLELNRRSTSNGIYPAARGHLLMAFGHLALDLGEYEVAAMLAGGGFGMREASGVAADPVDRMMEDCTKERLSAVIPAKELEEWLERGRRTDWEPWFVALVPVTMDEIYTEPVQIPNRNLIR
ncbi:MAG: adenylate/guanylate cyclase domain-containing protein [Armatimonadetes bacterium]|nr:adenylate/guanylate cyclase domain-containing protein [Armatimonadota bacterium]